MRSAGGLLVRISAFLCVFLAGVGVGVAVATWVSPGRLDIPRIAPTGRPDTPGHDATSEPVFALFSSRHV